MCTLGLRRSLLVISGCVVRNTTTTINAQVGRRSIALRAPLRTAHRQPPQVEATVLSAGMEMEPTTTLPARALRLDEFGLAGSFKDKAVNVCLSGYPTPRHPRAAAPLQPLCVLSPSLAPDICPTIRCYSWPETAAAMITAPLYRVDLAQLLGMRRRS